MERWAHRAGVQDGRASMACRAGVRACDAARGVSSGGRGHGQAAGIAGSMIVGNPDRGEGAIMNTRRHGYRLSVRDRR